MGINSNASLPSLEQLRALVITAAEEQLAPRFGQITRNIKRDGTIVTEADHAMQAVLERVLCEQWPEIPLLGEEMAPEQQQALLAHSAEKGLWILDPLDGTSNYAAGIPCFSVSLALLRDGEIQLGVVYDPIRAECFSAIRGQGAWLNGEPLSPDNTHLPVAKCMAQVDFKRLSKKLASGLVSDAPYSSQRSFGSSVLDWCWLAAGRVQLYIHGQQKLWDIAAGHLILEEAGGYAVTLEGEPVFHLGLEGRSVVAAAGKKQFQTWCSIIKSYQ